MIVDNGRRRGLVISGVFDGTCGESRGVISFLPNMPGKVAGVRGGLLDGDPVLLTLVHAPNAENPFATFRYRIPQ